MTTAPTTSTSSRPRHPPMSATATLTNCYVPLPIDSSSESSSSSSIFDPMARLVEEYGDYIKSSKSNSPKSTTSSSTTATTRGARTLRHLHLSHSILSQSTGSSLVEWGHTKVLCSVRGPRPLNCASFSNTVCGVNDGSSGSGGSGVGKGSLVCEVRYFPQIGLNMENLARNSFGSDFTSSSKSSSSNGGGGGGGKGGASNSGAGGATGARIPKDTLTTSQDTSLYTSSGGALASPSAFLDETYLSHRLYEALSPSVILQGIGAKCSIEVYVQVLQSDGGVFGAAVAAATLALVDAGVGMRDLVCAGSAAVIPASTTTRTTSDSKKQMYHVIADPTESEILQASGVVTIAMMPNWREVTVWDQFGKMSLDASREAMELARDGCVTINKFLRNCLMEDIDNGEGDGNGNGQ